MFDNDEFDEQDDFFTETNQQDFDDGSADFFSDADMGDSDEFFDGGSDEFYGSSDINGSNEFFDSDGINNNPNEADEDEFRIDEVPNLEQPLPSIHLGYKTVGVVVAVILVLIAFAILFLSRINIVKKHNTNNSSSQYTQSQQIQQNNTQQNQQSSNNTQQSSNIQQGSSNQGYREPMQQDNTPTYVEEQQPVVQNDNNSQVCVEEQPIVRDEPQGNNSNRGVSDNGMVTIPDSTSLDYSSNVTQAQGVVSSLTRYLQDGQVIYCVNLDISVGATTTPVHYYCGYNVYSQVSVGDILNVEYQQVSDNCFSVCTISK